MHWTRHTPHCERADSGHQVSATRHGPEAACGWQFAAWTPAALPDLSYWQWAEQSHHQARYARGQIVPQRSQCLGIYPTAAAARAACAAHHQSTTELPQ